MEPTTSGIKTWQWIVTVVVIIALIVIGILVFGGSSSTEQTTSEEASTTETVASNANRIVMSDQYPGNVVYLSSVQVDGPAWVAIHADQNGQPGKVIGSAHFDKGINPGRITLTQPTVEGKTYYAMLHSDNGDSKFDEVKDAPMKDANGNIIMRVFRASASVGEGLKG